MKIQGVPRRNFKKQRVFHIKLYFLLLIIILLIIGLVYVVIYSPIFRIKTIEVQNNNRLSEDLVLSYIKPLIFKTKLSNFLGVNNILAWPQGKINFDQIPISQIIIDKQWLRKSISIKVIERERFAIWCISNNQKCYWIDKNGIVFDEAPVTEGGLLNTISDLSENQLTFGKKVIDERFINNLNSILDNLSKAKLLIKKTDFNRGLEELKVETYDGFYILFSLRFNPVFNIQALQNLISKENLKNIEYFDLRVENKVYFKKN